tara:strand:- start:6252 stop:6683 length:432 start_codon:yes stop_codon:yes gene_type:complete
MIKDLKIGYMYKIPFSFTDKEVEKFAHITGDLNPIHLDDNYAKKTVFKRKIMHGFLSASIFSKIFGTLFPGPGTIYLEQLLKFKKPMYPNEEYCAKLIVEEINKANFTLKINTEIFDSTCQEKTISGYAIVLNKTIIDKIDEF